ncbi:MAG TPA: RES domain-containing protein [Candidatus Rubrimentiphilum sp.]|nr:RES domain-containing protein [Candidatus Rubrimentiphilum sp.]
MIAWRITKRKYATRRAVLSGSGARETGGRWNEPGLPLIYASENASLALLETLVQTSVQRLPKNLVIVQITIPENAESEAISVDALPADWKSIGNPKCVALGSAWQQAKRTLFLRVPSAVNPLESNLLLNPLHAGIRGCRVAKAIRLHFDPRLLSLLGG